MRFPEAFKLDLLTALTLLTPATVQPLGSYSRLPLKKFKHQAVVAHQMQLQPYRQHFKRKESKQRRRASRGMPCSPSCFDPE